ncbi:FAM172 family protein homolog CG10038 [Chironomus tepperi]|uniref:FAM172 family protein homolog CG10038 n=1 Tax=Chironomus tepperi TaxID=113505 RepID=UPI00391FC3C9
MNIQFLRKVACFFSIFSMSGALRKTVKDFGYGFNEDGRLRQLDPKSGTITDKPFQFIDQSHYEALGDAITDYVYDLMDQNGLTRHYIPKSAPIDKSTFIFSTFKDIKDIDKLMIIIHGSGVVRAGQWARSLIINDCINSGTVLPYVKQAQLRGYDVIITNTNDNYRDNKPIVGSESPEKHANYVWKNYIQPLNPKKIAIVAHSYGGIITTYLASKFSDDFNHKVFAVGFTDSVHGSRGIDRHLAKIGVNFVTSTAEINKVLAKSGQDVERRSAGTTKHEMTSYKCIDKLFDFIDEKEKEFSGIKKDEM